MKLCNFSDENELIFNENKELYKKAIFFDLEHYVYRKPVCVGVFGCCYYDSIKNAIEVTQYMIEGKKRCKKHINISQRIF